MAAVAHLGGTLSDTQRKRLLAAYEARVPTRDIAYRFGMSIYTVRRILAASRDERIIRHVR